MTHLFNRYHSSPFLNTARTRLCSLSKATESLKFFVSYKPIFWHFWSIFGFLPSLPSYRVLFLFPPFPFPVRKWPKRTYPAEWYYKLICHSWKNKGRVRLSQIILFLPKIRKLRNNDNNQQLELDKEN